MHFLSLLQTDGGLCKKKKNHSGMVVFTRFPLTCRTFCGLSPRWGWDGAFTLPQSWPPPLWFNAGCLMSSPDRAHLVRIAAQNVPPHSFTRGERGTLDRATSRWRRDSSRRRGRDSRWSELSRHVRLDRVKLNCPGRNRAEERGHKVARFIEH